MRPVLQLVSSGSSIARKKEVSAKIIYHAMLDFFFLRKISKICYLLKNIMSIWLEEYKYQK